VSRSTKATRIRFPDMFDRALRALTAAWVTTVIATALLVSALSIAPVWDTLGYFRALPGALSLGW
jgi:ABC-type arginine transport system permease subunit